MYTVDATKQRPEFTCDWHTNIFCPLLNSRLSKTILSPLSLAIFVITTLSGVELLLIQLKLFRFFSKKV